MSDNLRTMPAQPPDDPVPDAGALALELRHVVNESAQPSNLDPAKLPQLLALDCVAGPAQENGRTPQAQLVAVLGEILHPDESEGAHRGLALLLGLASTTKGYDAFTRRTRANRYLYDGVELDTFNRRRVQPLLNLLADELLEYDTTYRMRDTHDRLAAKLPASPALAVMWLDRFQYYFRMTTDLSGIENGLTVYLTARRDPQAPELELERRRRTSLWYLARFYIALGPVRRPTGRPVAAW